VVMPAVPGEGRAAVGCVLWLWVLVEPEFTLAGVLPSLQKPFPPALSQRTIRTCVVSGLASQML